MRGAAVGAEGGGQLTVLRAPCAQEINKHLVTLSLDLGGKKVRFDPCAHHTFRSFPEKASKKPGAAEPASEGGASNATGMEASGDGDVPDAGGAEATGAGDTPDADGALGSLDKDAMLYFKGGMTLKECCLMSAAAPTYFPSHCGQVDGGMFANVRPRPAALLRAIARHFLGRSTC